MMVERRDANSSKPWKILQKLFFALRVELEHDGLAIGSELTADAMAHFGSHVALALSALARPFCMQHMTSVRVPPWLSLLAPSTVPRAPALLGVRARNLIPKRIPVAHGDFSARPALAILKVFDAFHEQLDRPIRF
jgi:hypothetical protein